MLLCVPDLSHSYERDPDGIAALRLKDLHITSTKEPFSEVSGSGDRKLRNRHGSREERARESWGREFSLKSTSRTMVTRVIDTVQLKVKTE